jgi:cyclic pyranopterin phosphate synthase
MAEAKLTHVDEHGRLRMVDISGKVPTFRRAVAEARVKISAQLEKAITAGEVTKGNVAEVAKLAGVLAAKRVDELVPLCHTLGLEQADVRVAVKDQRVWLRAEMATTSKTGVEMEALTAVTVAALVVIDMGKAIDPAMVIEQVRVVHKSGGRRGTVEPYPAEFPGETRPTPREALR